MKTVAKHYINGQFVESHGRESLDLISPTTERIIGRVILGDEQDTRNAIRAAKEAFKTFSKTSVDTRARYLQALHDSVIARADEHIAIMVEEYGGVYQFSDASARRAARSFLEAKRALEDIPFTKNVGKSLVSLEPLGVAGLITPWNASTSFICGKLAAAIAAGCTAVVKPSELSALQVPRRHRRRSTRPWLARRDGCTGSTRPSAPTNRTAK
jgi:aldehyde dehydrogenase (NAD+)